MKKIILFGAGFFGETVYYKLSKLNEVIFYADNDKNKVGKKLHGVEIIDALKLEQIYDARSMDIVISSRYFGEIGKQLHLMGITQYYVIPEGLLYFSDEQGELVACCTEKMQAYRAETRQKSILFVQAVACIRTHKIANALKKYGWKVFLAYSTMSPEQSNKEYAVIYDNIYSINSISRFIEFVNESDFDYIHSSNEPDFLTAILNLTNKVVIHDCHDLSSAYKNMTPKELLIEAEANKRSSGVIYTTEGIRMQALKQFNIPKERTFVLENFISEELAPERRLEKLSASDGELHCVYEGGVIPHDKESHRYFEKIWGLLAESGVHVHFYTNCDKQYCHFLESLHDKIHYEGNFSSRELAVEMTKYDAGLCILNVTEKNRQYLEFASPNKIQEYVNAGIPVAVGNVLSQKNFVEEHKFGKEIFFDGDLYEQIESVAQIKIADNVLHDLGLTLESRVPQLVDFYRSCEINLYRDNLNENTDMAGLGRYSLENDSAEILESLILSFIASR